MEGYNRVPSRQDTDVVGKRIVAVIIDGIIGMVLYFALTALFVGGGAMFGDEGAGTGFFFAFFILPFAIFIGYYLLLEGLWDGYTVGKKVMGIKVVKENGSSIGLDDSVLRNLLRFIDGFFYYLVGFIFIATSDRKQRLGDRIASTVVVTDSPAPDAGVAPQQQGYQQGAQQQYQQGSQGAQGYQQAGQGQQAGRQPQQGGQQRRGQQGRGGQGGGQRGRGQQGRGRQGQGGQHRGQGDRGGQPRSQQGQGTQQPPGQGRDDHGQGESGEGHRGYQDRGSDE